MTPTFKVSTAEAGRIVAATVIIGAKSSKAIIMTVFLFIFSFLRNMMEK
jgi:hypothetical protein